MEYPIRINKYLAEKGICSRREADDLIAKGKVFVNGQVAEIGVKINENDEVTVSSNRRKTVYFALHKPVGVITHSPQKGEKGISDIHGIPKGVFPIGRLDKESRGIILLTNDGRVTGRLLEPDRNHEKEYAVKVDKKINNFFLRHMEEGIVLEDRYKTKPCQAKKTGDNTFSIILTEGKRHQIRRMCAALGYVVLDLKRERIMNIKLGSLRAGMYREIKGKELQEFLGLLGI